MHGIIVSPLIILSLTAFYLCVGCLGDAERYVVLQRERVPTKYVKADPRDSKIKSEK